MISIKLFSLYFHNFYWIYGSEFSRNLLPVIRKKLLKLGSLLSNVTEERIEERPDTLNFGQKHLFDTKFFAVFMDLVRAIL